MMIRSDVASKHNLETDDANNALQLNSTVVVTEGAAYHFRGSVKHKPRFVTLQDGVYLQVRCEGWDGVLTQTFPVDPTTGSPVWTLESDTYALTDMPLQATSNYGSFQGSTLWPDPDDATGIKCYTNGANDPLDAGIDDDDVTLTLSTVTKSFVPRGWVKIDSEWIYYDGYDNATDVDGKYMLYGLKRGELGTTAAAHLATTIVTEKLGKQIAPKTCKVENDEDGGTDYVEIRRGAKFDIHHMLGCFVLNKAAEGTYRASYSVYDAFDADAEAEEKLDPASVSITVNDIVTQMMTGSADDFGPGFVADDLDFDTTTGLIKVNRYDYDPEEKPVYVFDAIQDFLRSISLDKEVKFWFKHSTGKFRMKVISDDGSPAITLPNCSAVEEQKSLEDIYSGVRVSYSDDQTLNRATIDHCWHTAADGAGNRPTKWHAQWWLDNTKMVAESNDAGTFGTRYAIDDDPKTVFGATWSYGVSGDVDMGHFWFGAGTTPPLMYLKNMKLRIGGAGQIKDLANQQDYCNPEKEYEMHVEGCIDYDSDAHTGTWVDLGFSLKGKPGDNAGGWVTGEASAFSLTKVNAVRIVWDYMMGGKPQGGISVPRYHAYIYDLEINGDTIKYTNVQLTDTVKGDPNYYYAEDPFEKLRGGIKASIGTAGVQRVTTEDIGAGSENAAVSTGRLMLLAGLRLHGQRRWEYRGVLPGTPELGITLKYETTAEDYTGVLREYSMGIGAGGQTICTGVVLSTETDVIE